MSETATTGEIIANKSFNKKPKLTRKQKAFVNEIIKNPKQSATQAALKTYGKEGKPPTYDTARNIATTNLRKPSIISHLDSYNNIAEGVITNVISEYGNSDDIKQRSLSVSTAQWLHDKVNGKATIRTENTNLNIDIEQLLNSMQ